LGLDIEPELPFAGLNPDVILDAIETFELPVDGRLIALNSYENRVYQIGLEDRAPVVAKFYRPGRWEDQAILEEHAFSLELKDRELPIATPLTDSQGTTLVNHQGFRLALFEHLAGDWPELDRPGRYTWLGRLLGRLHGVGAISNFNHREAFNVAMLGDTARDFLLSDGFLPLELESHYAKLSAEVLSLISARLEGDHYQLLRLHGDCHPGNVLWSRSGPAFVDLDDCRMGPAIQDLWMLLSGDQQEQQLQLNQLLEGYCMFHEFDYRELGLIEALRSLRIIYYAGWLARRWKDPAFPMAFPWFGEQSWWQKHLSDLEIQVEMLEST
jgi:Ser/Thr protein kinase RdoA (MazF antagonist)